MAASALAYRPILPAPACLNPRLFPVKVSIPLTELILWRMLALGCLAFVLIQTSLAPAAWLPLSLDRKLSAASVLVTGSLLSEAGSFYCLMLSPGTCYFVVLWVLPLYFGLLSWRLKQSCRFVPLCPPYSLTCLLLRSVLSLLVPTDMVQGRLS